VPWSNKLERRYVLASSLWLVPLGGVLTAIVLSFLTLWLDRGPAKHLVPASWAGSAYAAQSVLGTAASSMMTLITLVLTVLTLAMQFGMGQFSPRIVRALLQDRPSQFSHALFAGTFVFAILGLRSVNVRTDTVPRLTVLVAYLLLIASVVVLLLYVHHAGNALRVAGLVDLVGNNLLKQLDTLYPAAPPAGTDPHVMAAWRPGILDAVEIPALVAAATRNDCRFELLPALGDYVPEGAPLLRCRPGALPVDDLRTLRRHMLLAPERSHPDDPAFGFRKLVDIAERSIATPFNDPTTAVEAIHRIHNCLRQVATRNLDTGTYRDEAGVVRLTMRRPTWDGLVELCFDELRLAGATSPQVTRRLEAVLQDLLTVVPPERRPALNRQQELLARSVERAVDDQADVDLALTPDAQGIAAVPHANGVVTLPR
jgi:uncharacterized membrane protein